MCSSDLSDYYSPLRDLLLRSADVEVPAWPAHRGPPLGLPCVRDRLGLPLLGMGALTHPQREPQDPAPPTPGALTVTPGLWPSVHRPRCCVWVGGEARTRRAHAEQGAGPGARLLHALSPQPVSASAAHILGEVCREKQEAAVPLVRLFLHYGRVVPFISAIASAEVRRTQ